jgi:pimeloyl-ACP methyl ester carboxylesterase
VSHSGHSGPCGNCGVTPRTFVFVNGILARSGDHDGWTDRAVTWTNTNTVYKAEKWEYTAGALTRRLFQQERAEKIATMVAFYQRAGYEVVLVGHSNGCDIIARVLALRCAEAWYFSSPIRSAHLFAPAADAADFQRALDEGDLQGLHIYGSANDKALKAGSISRTLFGWAGLGYGSLGLMNDATFLLDPRVAFIDREDFGHSDWFEKGARFESTMSMIHGRDAMPENYFAR